MCHAILLEDGNRTKDLSFGERCQLINLNHLLVAFIDENRTSFTNNILDQYRTILFLGCRIATY